MRIGDEAADRDAVAISIQVLGVEVRQDVVPADRGDRAAQRLEVEPMIVERHFDFRLTEIIGIDLRIGAFRGGLMDWNVVGAGACFLGESPARKRRSQESCSKTQPTPCEKKHFTPPCYGCRTRNDKTAGACCFVRCRGRQSPWRYGEVAPRPVNASV